MEGEGEFGVLVYRSVTPPTNPGNGCREHDCCGRYIREPRWKSVTARSSPSRRTRHRNVSDSTDRSFTGNTRGSGSGVHVVHVAHSSGTTSVMCFRGYGSDSFSGSGTYGPSAVHAYGNNRKDGRWTWVVALLV